MGSSERRHRWTVRAVRVRAGSTRPFRTVGWRSPSGIPHASASEGRRWKNPLAPLTYPTPMEAASPNRNESGCEAAAR